MALSEILLALLDACPQTHGYEIHARLTEIFPTDPVCERAEVYASLRRLEDQGFLESSWMPTANGRGRRQYQLLLAGRSRLADWLARPRPSRTVLRRTDLVRLAVVGSAWPARDRQPLGIRLRGKVRHFRRQREAIQTLRGFPRLVATRTLAHLKAEIQGMAELEGLSSDREFLRRFDS